MRGRILILIALTLFSVLPSRCAAADVESVTVVIDAQTALPVNTGLVAQPGDRFVMLVVGTIQHPAISYRSRTVGSKRPG